MTKQCHNYYGKFSYDFPMIFLRFSQWGVCLVSCLAHSSIIGSTLRALVAHFWCPVIFWEWFGNHLLDIFLLNLPPPFQSPKRPNKKKRDDPQKLSKKAKIAKANDFENMRFDIFVAGSLERQASQESPKTAKRAPKTALVSLQEPFEKRVHFLIRFLPENGALNCPRSGPECI